MFSVNCIKIGDHMFSPLSLEADRLTCAYVGRQHEFLNSFCDVLGRAGFNVNLQFIRRVLDVDFEGPSVCGMLIDLANNQFVLILEPSDVDLAVELLPMAFDEGIDAVFTWEATGIKAENPYSGDPQKQDFDSGVIAAIGRVQDYMEIHYPAPDDLY